MSDYNLGTARGTIEIDYQGGPAVRRARDDLNDTGRQAQLASERTNKAGNQIAGAGVVIAGGLALAVKSAADFEARLSAVQAVSGASADDMEKLRNKSLQLGKDTSFSASESASAIEELVKAGVSVQDVMNGAADATVALAAAGEVSMPEAAAIASNAMNQFNLAAQDLPNVADKIAGAANASAIDVKDFGYALSQVGAVANLAGVSFDDTATAIALMGNAGIKGSDAGTSLKSMFQRLIPTTEKQSKLMEELGLITEDGANQFYDAQGNMKSMSEVAGLLQNSLKGMSKEQKQATLTTLFGADAIRGAAILANNGSKGFDKMAESMGKVKAADVAATRMDNLQGSIEQLKGSLETLMIQVGTPLLKVLRTMVDGLTGVLNVVLSLPGPVLEAVTVFASMLAGLLLLVGGFLKAKAALAALRAGMLLFTGPIIAVIALIAALVAAFVYFYKNNEQFRAFVQRMAASLKELFGKAIEYLLPKLQELGAFLRETFQKALPYLKQFGTTIVNAFNAALPTIRKVIDFFGELAQIFISKVVPVIKGNVTKMFSTLVGVISKVWGEIQKTIPVVQDFIGSFVGLAKAILGSPAFQFLINILKVLAQTFVGTILPLLLTVGGIFQRVFVTVIGNAVATVIGVIRGMLNIISGVMKVITGVLTGNWSKAWEGVKQILRGAVGAIGALLRGLLSSAGAILRGLGSVLLAGIKAIPGLLKGAGGLFLAAGKFLIEQFVQGIKNAAGLIEGIATGVWNFVRGLLNGAISKINSALEFKIDPPGPGSVTINPPDIPQLAKGAVISAPTLAWIGEQPGNTEAVTPLSELWKQMDKVYKMGQTSTLVAAASSSGGGKGAGYDGPGRSRLVSGSLSIDRSGRAWIKGVAEDTVDGNERFEAAHGRMGRR